MTRSELLEFMDGKISMYYWNILWTWSKKREKSFFIFDRKFDVEPTIFSPGYVVRSGIMDFIIVY
jgi:putative flippase GtrA